MCVSGRSALLKISSSRFAVRMSVGRVSGSLRSSRARFSSKSQRVDAKIDSAGGHTRRDGTCCEGGVEEGEGGSGAVAADASCCGLTSVRGGIGGGSRVAWVSLSPALNPRLVHTQRTRDTSIDDAAVPVRRMPGRITAVVASGSRRVRCMGSGVETSGCV